MLRLPILLLLLFSVQLGGFAQKKDSWFRRNWTNMVARYNIYYHGQKILNEQVQDLVMLHKDDFSKPIDVYPYSDEATATSLKPKMETVLKKTSVVINKKSRSKWVDDSWLLAGKAYFFGGDLTTADENFQFVNSQYADQPIHYEAKLWILKTLVRDHKIKEAEAIYKTFERDEKFPLKLQDDLYLVAGDIYAKMGFYKEAQKLLELGLPKTSNKVLKFRTHFLLAQLYMSTKDYDKARNHYRTVSKMNAPYEFAFQSNIGIVKTNSLAGKIDTRESRKNLKKMLKDDKNVDYFDQLYFELGNLDLADQNNAKAIKNYQMCIRNAGKNPDLKTDAYLAVAKIYYEAKNYKLAEKYFDSTSMFISEKHPEYEKIKLQQSILSTLINHLVTIHMQDSLLKLADLPKDKLDAEIRRISEREKEAKKKAAKKAKDDNENLPDVQPVRNTSSFSGSEQFVFDDQAMLGREYNDFISRWGSRKLTDNWRILSIKKDLTMDGDNKKNENDGQKSDDSDQKEAGPEKTDSDLKKYYKDIPFDKKDKDLAGKKVLESHLEAGKIYHEKLKEYKEAIFHFESALQQFPGNAYEAELFYYLVKCYEELKNEAQTKIYRDKLAKQHPSSPYIEVLNALDPTTVNVPKGNNKNEKKEVLEAYEKMYQAFTNSEYEEAKKIKIEADSKYAGNAIQAQFDYLYALAVAKTEGMEKFMELLKQIKLNYPGTEIGAKAAYTLEIVENRSKASKLDSNSIYKYDGAQTHFFSLIMDEGQSDRIKAAVSNFNTKYFSDKNYKTKSYLLGNNDMLNIEVFGDKSEAMDYFKNFQLNFKEFMPDLSTSVRYFVISSDNLRTLLREMEASPYIGFFEKMYL